MESSYLNDIILSRSLGVLESLFTFISLAVQAIYHIPAARILEKRTSRFTCATWLLQSEPCRRRIARTLSIIPSIRRKKASGSYTSRVLAIFIIAMRMQKSKQRAAAKPRRGDNESSLLLEVLLSQHFHLRAYPPRRRDKLSFACMSYGSGLSLQTCNLTHATLAMKIRIRRMYLTTLRAFFLKWHKKSVCDFWAISKTEKSEWRNVQRLQQGKLQIVHFIKKDIKQWSWFLSNFENFEKKWKKEYSNRTVAREASNKYHEILYTKKRHNQRRSREEQH